MVTCCRQFMALWPLQSGYFMPWQVVTYAFMHGSMGHIFFNMMGLWMFGSELERIWGPASLPAVPAGQCADCGGVPVADLDAGWLENNPPWGASGGLFGLLLAYGMMSPQPHDHAFVPTHSDEGQGVCGGVRRAGVVPGRDGHHLGCGALCPPGRHAGRLADDALLARPAPVQTGARSASFLSNVVRG